MNKRKTKKEPGEATRAGVKYEVAKLRMAKSAREELAVRIRRQNVQSQAAVAWASSSAACKVVYVILL
jgi:hypothetical protein